MRWVIFRLSCSGLVLVSDKDSYRGTMRMKGTMDGRPLDMTQNFSGKRLGACTFEEPKKK